MIKRKSRMLIVTVVIMMLLGTSAHATKPCPPDPCLANQELPGKKCAAHVKWVAVGKIIRIKHDPKPFANCALEDRSACAQFNEARLTLKIEKMEKGKAPANGQIELSARYCAKPIPVSLDTNVRYRFYGNDDGAFVTYEPITTAKK